jgi:hypothetical protein
MEEVELFRPKGEKSVEGERNANGWLVVCLIFSTIISHLRRWAVSDEKVGNEKMGNENKKRTMNSKKKNIQ